MPRSDLLVNNPRDSDASVYLFDFQRGYSCIALS